MHYFGESISNGLAILTGSKLSCMRAFFNAILLIAYLIGGPMHAVCGQDLVGNASSVACQKTGLSDNLDAALLPPLSWLFAVSIASPNSMLTTATFVGLYPKWVVSSVHGIATASSTPPPKSAA